MFEKLHKHLEDHNLYPVFQSAYRREYHSTETGLLRVVDDILHNMNRQHVTILVLLDLSSAFDTVDSSTWDVLWNHRHSTAVAEVIFVWPLTTCHREWRTVGELGSALWRTTRFLFRAFPFHFEFSEVLPCNKNLIYL